MQKTIISLVVAVAVIAGGWYFLSSRSDSSDVVAIVNGETISRPEMESVYSQITASQGVSNLLITKEAQAEQQKQALEILISQALLRQAVERSGIIISQTDIDTQMNSIKARFESEAAFGEALVAEGLTEASLAVQLKKDLTTEAYLNRALNLNTLTASDAEIEEAYQKAIEGVEDAPALEEVRDQVKESIIGQERQALVNQHIQELRTVAEVKILI